MAWLNDNTRKGSEAASTPKAKATPKRGTGSPTKRRSRSPANKGGGKQVKGPAADGPEFKPDDTIVDADAGLLVCMEEFYAQRSADEVLFKCARVRCMQQAQ